MNINIYQRLVPDTTKKSVLTIIGLTSLLFGVFYFATSRRSQPTVETFNPEFKEYISAYTSGYVTSDSKIRVVLQNNNPEQVEINKPVDNDLFKFSPDISGEMVWVDQNIVEFQPKKKLKNGETYEVKFKLGEITDVKKELKTFRFVVHTIPQAIDIQVNDIVPNGEGYNISGTASTSDQCEKEDIEKSLIASIEEDEKKITWTHENSTTHHFTISGINRDNEVSKDLILNYTSEPIGGVQSGEAKISIPSKKEFKVIECKLKNGTDQQLTVFFSDKISNKNAEGIFSLEENNDANFSLEGNKLQIFPTTRLQGNKNLTLSNEITNSAGKKISGRKIFPLIFEALKPEIRFAGKGNIIPTSDKTLLPFEAVNISAVDVKIKRIYEKNILQFLQVNNLDGEQEINRVGTVVFKKKIPLTSLGTLPKDKWQKYALDLSTLIKTEPGAIYNVSLNFRKSYSIYDCMGNTSSTSGENYMNNEKANADQESEDEEKDWDNFYEEGAYVDYSDYDYQQRDNPCHPTYYAEGRGINRNIISTNTALVAKRGNDGSITVMTSDILSATPIGGVEVEAYDYQQIPVGKTTTDGNGIGKIKLNKKPFVLMAKNGKQRTFVKMDDGSSLSMSMFEVEGEEIKKGMKGFIYGERGIWRPGDSLYLTFILENKNNDIPENFPVSMELLNPQGQVFQKITRTESLDGFYNFSTRTESYSPTGNWMAKVKAGGAVFTKNIRIETVMPNRLKLNLDFKTDLLRLSEDITGDLNVKWLHGAPGRNLNTKVDVLITKGKTEFKGFKDYVFDNTASNYYSESQTIFSGRTDENGDVKVKLGLSNMSQAPGFMTANFTVRGFEEGGAFSTDRFSLPVSPYKQYVGLKSPKAPIGNTFLYTGENHKFDLTNVDENGKPVSADVQVKVYKLSWRWWWDDLNDDLSSYMSTEVHTPVLSKEVNLSNGKGSFNFKVESQEWGRYLIVAKNPETGHTTSDIVFLDWPAWEGKSPKGNEGANFLGVTTDKPEYNINDFAKIHFPTAEGTKAFITVENGSRVIKSFWADTEKDSTDAWVEITEDMTPNVYIYVTLIQPHKQSVNDLPIRLYGVASIKVNDPSKMLHPKIASPDVWKPETETYVRVSENEGKEMTYTLAVVDEGLLDITRFKTPDPYSAFNSKEALGVKTWDVYDQVMGANAAGIQRILAVGGDANLKATEELGAKRFIPMVRYLGPFHLDKGEINTHKIKVPQYVGSVRVMVVAGYENGYGKDEKTIAVRKPLMILSTLPRVLGPGEEVDLPVTVFAMEKKVKNAKISVNPGSNFEIVDASSKNISFAAIGDQIVNFRLRVKESCGWGTVRITAEGAGEICKEEINIEVRSPNPKMADIKEVLLDGGKSFRGDYKPFGMGGTNSAVVEISSIPALNLEKRLNYLIEYPHGCIEQTTSGVFAQLYLGKLVELNSNQKEKVATNIKAAVNRIKTFQTSGGGFSYWPGLNASDEWGTSYAGHFLLEAQKASYVVPSYLLDNWKNYQKNAAIQWQGSKNAFLFHEDLNQAYRLYTLALAGIPELGAMNRLKENKNLSIEARWRLAAAYVLAGQKEVAKKMINGQRMYANKYDELGITYGSGERDDAMILETLTLLNEKSKAFESMRKVAGYLGSDMWLSTQSTAYCLLSVSSYAERMDIGKGISAECKIGSETFNIKSGKSYAKIEIVKPEKSAQVTVKNNGKGMLFTRIIRQGIPAAGEEVSKSENLGISINYKTMSGSDLNVSDIQQGTDFVAEITITNEYSGYLTNLALSQIFPSGWEIHNARLDENSGGVNRSDVPTYQDIRDDRILSYFDLGNGRKKTFKVVLNAAYTGRFYLPGIKTEAMYNNNIYATQKGMWVEVSRGRKV
ncbi:MAG: alpha-2-macroglobulin family protein [Bacteroidota bacterium]|jgi:uncharacterized protein YfaS (alpha-2-macroglobulin family)